MGFVAVRTIPIELQPEIKIPIASVATALPGANPESVESLITEPIEKAISGIDGIKSINSTSALSLSSVVVEFDASEDITEKVQEIKDRVDLIISDLPEDATDPQISKAEANNAPIVAFSIVTDRDSSEVNALAEELQDELEALPGVSRIQISGDQKERVEVTVDQQKADSYGLTISQIAQSIKAANLNLPAGIINTDKLNYSVRIDNRLTSLEDIKNTPLFTANDENSTPILLRDVATVEVNKTAQTRLSNLSINGNPPAPTVSLQLYKEEGGNIVSIVDSAKAKIEELKASSFPEDVEIAITNDLSKFIRTDLGILINSGYQTTSLIVLLLFLALGFKEGILAGLSIPLSLLAAVFLIQAQGLSINGLSLFSLVIALGLMVDTAIVMMEGIHENMRKGMSSREAAIQSIETYKWPLIAGTMTTIFAFLPMLLVSGIVGQFLRTLPITISGALLSSLFISLTIVPAIAVKFLKKKDGKEKNSILQPIFDFLGRLFERLIQFILKRRITRVLVILLTLGLFMGSMSLPGSGKLPVEMFPKTDLDYFFVNIEAPTGLALEETKKIVTKVEAQVQEIPELDNYLTIIGSGQSLTPTDIVSFDQGGNSNLANITITLTESATRERKSYDIAAELREDLQQITEASIFVQEATEGPPSDAPIVARITGNNIEDLRQVSDDILDLIKEVPGTTNVRNSLKPGLNEFKFVLDPEKVSFHGLSSVQVAGTIRNYLQGIDSTEIKLADEDIDIIVQSDINEKNGIPETSIKDLEAIEIVTPKGYTVALGEIAEYTLQDGIASIAREDETRIAKVRSDLQPGKNAAVITKTVQDKIAAEYQIPAGVKISFGGDTSDVDQSFQELFRSMIIAVILIAATLVLVFNSMRQPFIVLLTLPMALIGVFPGLMSVGLALSFPAFLGVVALSGVVVNDAIVLIDRINSNRQNNMPFTDAIAESAQARLQPIIMTTITTVAGILPLALTNEFWAGLGFSLIFGLIAATFLTLVVIPVLYYMFEGRRAKKLENQM